MSGQFGKEEIVHIHLLLFQIKKFLENLGVENEYFREYETMNISPVQIFRQKFEHREAIIKLCYGIMKALGREEELDRICHLVKGSMKEDVRGNK
uniref:Metal-binding protein n=1 Tax=Archaeoglobus fulgidus TaxID=2234 RepID=A0A7J2THY5_ARCFL